MGFVLALLPIVIAVRIVADTLKAIEHEVSRYDDPNRD